MSWDELRAAAHASRAAFDANAACRLALALEKNTDSAALISRALGLLSSNAGKASWSSPEGVYFASGPSPKLAVLFPGQGAQYVGMGRDLVCSFPKAFEALESADAAFSGPRRLSDFIFPQPAWNAQGRERQEKELRSTDVAQPALGAAALGAWRVLRDFGVKAEAFAGHSYGELVALHAAGRLEEGSLHALSGLRGRLMAAGGGDRGSMLAAQASAAELEAFLREEKLALVLANKNAPHQNVLSGATAEIEKAEKLLGARGLKAVRLPVSAAFHSPLVAGALEPFAKALEDAPVAPGSVPVYANSTGEPYPADARAARALLAGQLAKPVEFTALIERLHADGVRLFVECGAGARLTGLVGQILHGREFAACALDASAGRKNGIADLARLLAQLAVFGRAELSAWQGGEAGLKDLRPKPKMSVTLTGAPYRSSKPKPRPAKTPVAMSAAPAPAAVPARPAAVPGEPGVLNQALAAAQASIDALTRLQEQTAQLHLQFLQGQDSAQRSVQALVEQQQALYARIAGGAPVTSPAASQLAPALVPTPSTASLPAPIAVAPAPAPVAAPAAPKPELLPVLLSIVSEKTGYPADTINPDMDLEADLGIDSIKRVEILSAVSEKLPGAPKVKPEHLGTLRTLKSIAGYLAQGMTSAPAAAAPAPAASAPAAAAPKSELLPVLLGIVSEKTGYPAETIGPDMDLEADLGIDSIKRVEILSAVSEKLPGAPKVKPEHLGTLRTLKSIADYLAQGMSSAPRESHESRELTPEQVRVSSAPAGGLLPVLLGIVSDKTGYPAETINPDMDLEGDLGIDSIKRVEILSAVSEKLPGAPKVKPEHLGTLRTLKSIADYLAQGMAPAVAAPAPAAAAAAAPIAAAPAAAPIAAAPAAAPAEPSVIQRLVPELVPVGPRDAFPLDKSLTVALTRDSGLDQALARELADKGFKTVVVSLDEPASLPAELGALVVVAPARPAGERCPWSADSEAWLKKAFLMVQAAGRSFQSRGTRGLVLGLTRMDGALGCEGAEHDPALGGLAGLLKTAAREWKGVSCRALDLEPALTLEDAARLAARELGFDGPAELAAGRAGLRALALAERPAVEGRDPLAPGDVVLVTGGARGVTAESALALAQAFRCRLVLLGRSPLPGAEPEGLSAARTEAELRAAIASREKGLAPKAVGERARALLAAREIRETLRRLSDAGVEARYRAVDVRDAAAVAVLLEETRRELGPVRGLVHGAGVLADKLILEKTPAQLDAVLDTKLAGLRHLLEALPAEELRLLALFSSSTARYGRAGQSDYAIANEVLNKAARVLSRRRPGCRTIALGWGPWDGGMVTPELKKLFASEGVGVIGLAEGGRHLAAEARASGEPETVVLAAKAEPRAALPPAFERDLSLETHPVLRAHVVGGRAVVPLALSAEWLAQGAMHAHPGLLFAGLDELRVTRALPVPAGRTVPIRVHAGAAERRDGLFLIPAELRGPGGALHASAKVVLASKRAPAPAPALAASGAPYRGGVERAYAEVLFHGPELRVLRALTVCGADGIAAETRAAAAPSEWMRSPLRERWLADPAALDAAFQAMILWTQERMGAPSLPSFAARYRQFADFPETGARLVARAESRGDGLARADFEFLDERGALIARLEGYECAVDAALAAAFKRGAAEAAA